AGNAIDELSRLVRKRDDERAAMAKETADLQKKYEDLDAKLAAAKKDLENALAAAKTAADKAASADKAAGEGAMVKKKDGEELAGARAQIKDLLKKLDEASALIIDLQGQKQKLADKYDKFQKETEARFAGIVTSGKRVVFLVDISGSMGKKDSD